MKTVHQKQQFKKYFTHDSSQPTSHPSKPQNQADLSIQANVKEIEVDSN